MVGREAEELRDRARRCRELSVGYDERIGATLRELADELEQRAAALEQGWEAASDETPRSKIHPPLPNMG